MPEYCEVERDGRILTVTLNRPEVVNALHPPANAELEQVFDDFAANPDLWVAIITGAGNDPKYQASASEGVELGPKGFAGLTARFDNLKPLIAAVGGVSMGGGFEIALACDLIIACAPLSVRASKQCDMEGLEKGGVEAAASARYPALRALLESEHYIEGPRAFAERRRPSWKGR